MACEDTSIEMLLTKATVLAFRVLYEEAKDKTLRTDLHLYDPDAIDEAWAWADGLPQKYIVDHVHGRCSLLALIDFNLAHEEERVKQAIAQFEQILEQQKEKV